MKSIVRSLVCAVVLIVGAASGAVADLMVGEVGLRATVGGMKATGGYVTIHNHGDQDDRLVGVQAPFAKRSEIHTMEAVDGVMKMRPVDGGLHIPAGGELVLKPGGQHLMFMGLTEALAPGSMHAVTLQFENAGLVTVMAQAKRPADLRAGMHSDHNHSGHDHSEHEHSDHDDHSGHDDHSDHDDHSGTKSHNH